MEMSELFNTLITPIVDKYFTWDENDYNDLSDIYYNGKFLLPLGLFPKGTPFMEVYFSGDNTGRVTTTVNIP